MKKTKAAAVALVVAGLGTTIIVTSRPDQPAVVELHEPDGGVVIVPFRQKSAKPARQKPDGGVVRNVLRMADGRLCDIDLLKATNNPNTSCWK